MEIIDVATLYLDALISHDAPSVPLEPDARRINNGKVTVEGSDALRAIIRREPVAAIDSLRWLVDGEQAIVFYDLDADLARGEGEVTSPPDQWMPAYIGERFWVRAGRIEEIEVVYAAAPGQPRPERPVRYPQGYDTRAEVLAAAKAYIAALVSHNAAAVPLSDEVWRIENGKTTGDGADALRKSLESDGMQAVQGVSDERWFASADSAVVFYTLLARAGARDLFMRIAERFRIVDGRLVEIEAVFSPKAS